MRILNEEQQKWVDIIGEFAKKEIEPIMLDWDKVVDPSQAIPFDAYEKAFKLGRLLVMGADKTYLPVALLAAGVVVTDGTTAVTCTAADADPT